MLTNVCTIDDYVESIALRMDESVITTKKVMLKGMVAIFKVPISQQIYASYRYKLILVAKFFLTHAM